MAIKHAITMAAAVLFGLLSGAGVAAAKDQDLHCEVDSDYDLTLNARSLILIRGSGTPQRLVMRYSSTTAGWH
ncbi:hypothetical protein XAR_3085 [Xanthomonas citri pv. glycines str. 8ra]|nr:hypothetical protein XAR_3085 [Xanthomonas citri pv. glycines str. 8ra]